MPVELCTVENCTSDAFCKRVCTKHCKTERGCHCSVEGCTNRLAFRHHCGDVCEEHCKAYRHKHCSVEGCAEKFLCPRTRKCSSHVVGDGILYYCKGCEFNSDLCKYSSQYCHECCPEEDHDHDKQLMGFNSDFD